MSTSEQQAYNAESILSGAESVPNKAGFFNPIQTHAVIKESGLNRVWLVCGIRKGRECKKPVEVCKVCKKRQKCKAYLEYEQPKLKGV